MKWRLVSDSSCDLFTLDGTGSEIEFDTVPFTIRVGDKEYTDDEHMPVEEMLTANENHAEMAQTACPAPEEWLQKFRPAEGPVLGFTISSALSGSYNSACTAMNMLLDDEPDRKIDIIDTRATGAETVILLRKAVQLIRDGLSFENVVAGVQEAARKTHTIFALSSYHNLIKAGRVSRLVGFIAGHLGFWGIGIGNDEGEIAMRGKARGTKAMIRLLMEEIQKIGVAGKEIFINHCQNAECAEELRRQLKEAWPGVSVHLVPTRGLDSFYAERHGIIIGF